REAMFTLLVPCVSSSTTAMRWVDRLTVSQPARPRAARERQRGAKRRIGRANTFVSIQGWKGHSGEQTLISEKRDGRRAAPEKRTAPRLRGGAGSQSMGQTFNP